MRALRVQIRNSRFGISESSDPACEGPICIGTGVGLRCPIRPVLVRPAPSAVPDILARSSGESISWRSNS